MANALLYGFSQLKDLANQRAVEVRGDVLQAAIINSVAEHNREINALVGLFCKPTTEYSFKFRGASAGRLQAGDENSRALPTKGSVYDVAFPIQKGDDAWGANKITRTKMTVQDVNNAVSNVLSHDATWVRDHVMAALFYNSTGWTFNDPQYGSLTIQGLANGDAVTYFKSGGGPAADTHQLAQAAAIADATNPYPTIYSELIEHPENSGGDIITFIATDQVATTQALAAFIDIADPNIRPGNSSDSIVGTPGVSVPGSARLLGRTANQWVYEWASVPSGYLISVATGGEPPLAMRQDPEAELQGLVRDTREDFPFAEEQYFRRAGWGAWNRVGAVVTRTGNGSYAIPTSFGSPMY